MRVGLYILCLFITQLTFGQNKPVQVDIVVLDSINRPIERASITQLNKDSTAVAYGFSNKEGRCQALLHPLATHIQIAHINYKKTIIPIDHQTQTYRVKLETQYKEIEEVVVTNYKEKDKDTITYVVRNVASGTEMNLEDLLAKLPGMEVIGEKILYKGAEIQKILIDGDDLVGNTYQKLSKFISPKILDSINIYTGYQENHLRDGIIKSKAVAVNISTKDDLQRNYFGGAQLAGATAWGTRSSLSNLLISKKLRLQNNYAYNNIGVNNGFLPSSSINAQQNLLNIPSNFTIPEYKLLNWGLSSAGGLPTYYSLYNNARYSTLDASSKFNNKTPFKINFGGYMDRKYSTQVINRQILDGETVLAELDESRYIEVNPKKFDGSFYSAFDLNKKSRIQVTLKSYLSQEEGINEVSNIETIEKFKNQHFALHANSDYTYKLNDNKLLEISTAIAHMGSDENRTISGNIQKINTAATYLKSILSFIEKGKDPQVKGTLIDIRYNSGFFSNIMSEDSLLFFNGNLVNGIRNNNQNEIFSLNTYYVNKMKFGGGEVNYKMGLFYNRLFSKSENIIGLNPAIHYRKRITRKTAMNLSYSLSDEVDNNVLLYDSLLTHYNQVRTYLPYVRSRRHSISSGLKYDDNSNQFFTSLSFNYGYFNPGQITVTDLQDDYFYSSAIYNNHWNKNAGVKFTIEKLVRKLKFNPILELQYSKSNYKRLGGNGDLLSSSSDNLEADLFVFSRLKGKYSFYINVKTLAYSFNDGKVWNMNTRGKINHFLNISPYADIKFTNTLINTTFSSKRNFLIDSQLTVRSKLNILKRSYPISLEVNNLFNYKSMGFETLTEIERLSSFYYLRPRHVIFATSFTF